MQDIEYFFQWGEDNSEELIRRLEKNPPRKFVLFMPEEYEAPQFFNNEASYWVFKRFCDYHKIEFIIITGTVVDKELNPKYYLNNAENIYSWSTYFNTHVIAHSLTTSLMPFNHYDDITKHFCSLNGRAHPYRCRFIDHMYKNNLFKHGYISWHNAENWNTDEFYKFRWWTPETLSCDPVYDNAEFIDIFTPPIKAFKDSLFSIVSESNPDYLFITEKTYVPIYHQRPFLIFGAPYTHEYLKSLGFKMFDEVIDYSFDKELDEEIRCEMFMKQVKRICKYDIKKLKELLDPIVMHNFRNAFRITDPINVHQEILTAIREIPNGLPDHYKAVFEMPKYNEYQELQKRIKGRI